VLWVRGGLLVVAALLVTVFVIAIRLDPYEPDGTPLRQATHRQLGLPPCTFYDKTGLPCPSCGMTTSFSLLLHGDPVHSLEANSVGTLLASFCLLVIPWALASVVKRRALFLPSLEKAVICVIVTLVVLMLSRWLVVIGLAWWTGTYPPF
jgi:hypothetical protein